MGRRNPCWCSSPSQTLKLACGQLQNSVANSVKIMNTNHLCVGGICEPISFNKVLKTNSNDESMLENDRNIISNISGMLCYSGNLVFGQFWTPTLWEIGFEKQSSQDVSKPSASGNICEITIESCTVMVTSRFYYCGYQSKFGYIFCISLLVIFMCDSSNHYHTQSHIKSHTSCRPRGTPVGNPIPLDH